MGGVSGRASPPNPPDATVWTDRPPKEGELHFAHKQVFITNINNHSTTSDLTT